ncbi:hypothetical protein A3086_24340 [Salmonella enterica subsp. enterica serovar Schwarzengrund]|nr:hypothetical protein [Salmonella enterica subsp. enterica serovar Schwarzengrund]
MRCSSGEAEPIKKQQRCILFRRVSPRSCAVSLFPARESAVPAAVSRPERSDRVSEEAQFPRFFIMLLRAGAAFFLPFRSRFTPTSAQC